MPREYFSRHIFPKLLLWLDRKEIFAIKVPRQSGKTTILRMLQKHLVDEKKISPQNVILLSLEDRDLLKQFSQNPKQFLQSYFSSGNTAQRYYVLLDEYQYVKEGGQKIKLLYDLFEEKVKFVITGSSSLELTASTNKYLVGRVFSFTLYPLSFAEFLESRNNRLFLIYQEYRNLIDAFIFGSQDFSVPNDIFKKEFQPLWEEYALYGGYPEVVKTSDFLTKREILKNIYETYITKDIIELLNINNYANFRTLVVLLAHRIGTLLNYQELATESSAYFKELKKYLSILEETYVLKQIKPYHKNPVSELRKNPKLYFIDSGLRNYIASDFNPISQRINNGSVAENLVFQSLLNWQANRDFQIHYWRTIAKAEVDFVIQHGDKIIPIEVKFSKETKPKISRSFRNFIEKYQPKFAIVATRDFWGELKQPTRIKFVPILYL